MFVSLKIVLNNWWIFFYFTFTRSLQFHKVKNLWKDSLIMLVPKSKAVKSLNNYRPVVLTSLSVKFFEKIVKDTILSNVSDNLDLLQFACRPDRGVDDAKGTLLKMILTHLETVTSVVLLVHIDFSSALNCIQPHILAERLSQPTVLTLVLYAG